MLSTLEAPCAAHCLSWPPIMAQPATFYKVPLMVMGGGGAGLDLKRQCALSCLRIGCNVVLHGRFTKDRREECPMPAPFRGNFKEIANPLLGTTRVCILNG